MTLLSNFDGVGYMTTGGVEYCYRCVPFRYRHEIFELLRFEATGECDHCGTDLTVTPFTLDPTWR